MMKRWSCLLLAVVVVLSACKRGEKVAEAPGGAGKTETQAAQTTTVAGTEAGAMMPAYVATNLDGTKFDLASRRGKVVLLNVWATWCGPCRYEIPELQRMHDLYGPRGFEVIGASVDEGEPDTVRQFVTENKMTYPVVLDPEGKSTVILDTSVLPTSVLIGRDGKIVWKKVGAILEGDQELKTAIEKTLG